MKVINASNNIMLWGELVDLGIDASLQMIKKSEPYRHVMNILKNAIESQSEAHHQANIQIFRRLKHVQSGYNKNFRKRKRTE